jgi:hypothetical protein
MNPLFIGLVWIGVLAVMFILIALARRKPKKKIIVTVLTAGLNENGEWAILNKTDHIPDPRKKVNPDWCMNQFECNINDKSATSCMGCELHFRNIQL